ncbi:MAG TPA: YdeI/OmpD-associated family protein [Gemmatimonadaceae bacterium]|nr:YdeI/OmpD-associated family protein [Gemmatimonadaceae bacterium]
MGTKDKRIDAYIAKAPEFAKPILDTLRATVHEACPECEETLKWSHPTFMYHGILCAMVAFKEYALLRFWKEKLLEVDGRNAVDVFGKATSVNDLPSKKLMASFIRKAMALNAEGTPLPKRPTKPKKALVMPDDFMAAIRKNKKALAAYDRFSPSHQREYVEWIVDAKREETRAKRIAQAVEWMAEGKPRNWKYM